MQKRQQLSRTIVKKTKSIIEHAKELSDHYDAEVYPNRQGQICPMLVSRVRFYYVNTLKVEHYCGN